MGLKRAFIRCLPSSTNRLRRAATRFARQNLPADLLARIEATPGCLDFEQGALLYHLAAHPDGEGCVVEIGSFMGKSTLWLGQGVMRAGGGKVYSIDPHDGHERPEVCPELDSFTAFQNNIGEGGVANVVVPLRQRSQAVAKDFQEPVRLLWVDGSHTYEDVLADLQGFVPRVVTGGYVALHDTRGRHFPGVRQAMLEFFGGHREFTRIVRLRNMVVYRHGY